MFKASRRSILKASAASIAAASLPKISNAQAASFVPPQHSPEDLKGILTPFGAVRAGNADGSIPAWTGGYSTVAAGYRSGDLRSDPFPDEKPLYVIASANLDQYKDKLSDGQLGLFAKHPDYSIQVFPTHRTAIAPQYVYDNIHKNATRATLSADGVSLTGAYGGIPFPIPQNGHEVMWNHVLAFSGTTVQFQSDAYVIPTSGAIVFESRVNCHFQYPYYFENGEEQFKGFYLQQFIVPIAPPYEAGGSILTLQPVDPAITPVEAWTYLEGQRRVRRAPELQYDTPNSLAGGATNWDEANIFSGEQNEYDFNFISIKEAIVPYNSNKTMLATIEEQYKPSFLNPDVVRFELHRCRVVELTVKPGFRNVDARRVIYFDEDTGSAMLEEVYDASGKLWKFIHNIPYVCPDIPCLMSGQFFVTYDLHAGNYVGGNVYNADTYPQWKPVAQLQDSFFTPGQLAAQAGGF
jgi:hypothetical protein